MYSVLSKTEATVLPEDTTDKLEWSSDDETIVKVKDGKVIGDSDPFEPEKKAGMAAPVHKNLGKASMNFFTSLALSFNNLWTKKTRTILVAFAGSIGIIGIALILSMSEGVNNYIDRIEAQTLSQYPLSIERSTISFMSMMMVQRGHRSRAALLSTKNRLRV